MPARLTALFGPTAVGKTEVAIALADRMRARGEQPVAVSADALQIYAGLQILTGAPDPEQRARLEHRLLAIRPVHERFSVAEYCELAHDEIDGLLAAGAQPIVVGGTGLYLRAALAELELRPPPAPGVRERLEAELLARGPQALHSELALAAPWAAETIDPRDRHRIVRSLELLEQGALTQPQGPNRLWTSDTRHPTRLVGLVRPRDELYERIDARVDAMVAAGAIDEVRRAEAAGASPTARVALGFEELLRGDVEAMKQRTRRYARRQLTWMRKLADIELVDIGGRGPEEVAAAIDSAPA
ncbi:MAG: tRNA (adenosine(37)-N6)-dimethylallyltransferase MiaA [Solirubrobacteraceae bacterium]